MKHALRKFISPCASALFMVVSTMAALIVLVTAMYMSVISSGQVQITQFDHEQAYVSAASLSDILCAYLADEDNSNQPLRQKLASDGIKEGESISTNGNGFASFTGSDSDLDDTILGAYDVVITRLKDEQNSRVYDIAVTVSNNGVLETVHTQIVIAEAEPSRMPAIEQFFTATGYLPNDVFLDSMDRTDSPLVFDAEYVDLTKTVFANGGSGDPVVIMTDVICSGSLRHGYGTVEPDKALTWIIGNDLLLDRDIIYSLGYGSDRGKICVGGDFSLLHPNAGVGNSSSATDLYVQGDAYFAGGTIYGDVYIGGDAEIDKATFNGDVYIMGDAKFAASGERLPRFNGRVYIFGNVTGNAIYDDTAVCSSSVRLQALRVLSDKVELMNEKIGGSMYPKWTVESDGFDSVVDIAFNADPQSGDDDPVPKYVEYINYDCTIGDIYNKTGATNSEFTIIIDTGDSETSVRKLRLSANCDSLGIENTFMWFPGADKLNNTINIITIGKGSLLIDVPEGVTYQATDYEFFGHVSWFMLAGGTITKDKTEPQNSEDAGYEYYMFKRPSADSYLSMLTEHGFIHDGCSVCTYAKDNIGGQEVYTCTTHGGTFREDEYLEYKAKKRTCLCDGRIDESAVDDYLISYPNIMAGLEEVGNIPVIQEMMAVAGENASRKYTVDYPNVNIFVASCDKSADIRFGCKPYSTLESDLSFDDPLEQNKFFGYVYAPYMTFVSAGSGGGDIKCAGGLITSDYVISSDHSYIFVQPTRTIENIGASDIALKPVGNRDWRVYGS